MTCVYGILTTPLGGVRFVKFGYATSLADRVTNLQTGCPIPFQSVHYVECRDRRAAEQLEAAIHAEHAESSVCGEWFLVANDGNPEHDIREAMEMIAARELGAAVVQEFMLPKRLSEVRRVGRLQRRMLSLGVIVGDRSLPGVKYRGRRARG